MKSMKNIKPTYAVKLGKGVFAGGGPTYQCRWCGKKAFTPKRPLSTDMGSCEPGHKGHFWEKC